MTIENQPVITRGLERCMLLPHLQPDLHAPTHAEEYVGGAGVLDAMIGDYTTPRARVYRTDGDPQDPELGPCWHWRCCDITSNGCAHTVTHKPGSWRAAMCGALRHAHARHPPVGPRATVGHTTMFGRQRCDWSRPTREQIELASWTLCGRLGMPRGTQFREFAREILSLAGRHPG
jgi:hypothetical protein